MFLSRPRTLSVVLTILFVSASVVGGWDEWKEQDTYNNAGGDTQIGGGGLYGF